MEEIAIGIDLGTSNSVIGVFQKNQVEIAPNSIGDTYTPSIVDILDEGELIGEETMLHKIDENNSKNRITEIKRIIGRKFSSLTIQEKEKYNAIEDPKNKDQILIKVTRKNQDEFLSPEAIMACIFKKLIKSASNFINTNIRRAVITHPAYYDYNQKAAIIEAAKLSGINILRIITEPTAAALAYGLGKTIDLKDSLAISMMKQDNKTNRKVMVFDLGGGTFDVSILSLKDSKEFKVITTNGDRHLGGDDFDSKLVNMCIKKFCKAYEIEEAEIRQDKNIKRRLKIQCEKAKKKLSYQMNTSIKIYNFYKDHTLYVDITRDEFDELCEDLYERIKEVLDKVIAESKLSIDELDDIVVVGGSSRIPKIKTILTEKYGASKIRDKLNPDEAVAIGATWQAHKIIKSNKDINIIDITPFSLGVATKNKNPKDINEGPLMSILIPKDKEISCRSEERLYKTVDDNQKFFKIQLYAGEDKFCKNNDLLKEFTIENLPEGKAGTVTLKIYLEINKDGIVFINAEVESTGQKKMEQYSLYDYNKISSSLLQSSKKKPKIKGKEKLEEIKELTAFMKEKNKLLTKIEDNEQKFKCLKNLSDSCAKLIEIYSELIEQNDSDNLYQKLIDNYKRILKYYSEMLIINNDPKINDDLMNKIKEIITKLLNDDIENMMDIFDILKEQKQEQYILIIIFTAELLYKEGEKILEEGKNYSRYYSRKYFLKADKVKSNIDQKMVEDMDYNLQKIYEPFKKKYLNKVDLVDAFVNSLKKGIKMKGTPYITGFTSIKQLLDQALKPENVSLALDILTEMVSSLSQDKKKITEEEAFCLVNIIKIKYSYLLNQSLNDINSYENMISRIKYLLENGDFDGKSWIDQFNDLEEQINKKKEELLNNKKNNKTYIDELRKLYESSKEKKNPMEFINFIIEKYPYSGYDASKHLLNLNCAELLEIIFPKYHPDNYIGRDDYDIYNEIYILLVKIEEDLKKNK